MTHEERARFVIVVSTGQFIAEGGFCYSTNHRDKIEGYHYTTEFNKARKFYAIQLAEQIRDRFPRSQIWGKL